MAGAPPAALASWIPFGFLCLMKISKDGHTAFGVELYVCAGTSYVLWVQAAEEQTHAVAVIGRWLCEHAGRASVDRDAPVT